MYMRLTKTAVLAVGLALSLVARLGAEEYFVGKGGNDANDGLTRAAAFRTVQKGVDALQPGDTLTIGPGEYHEAVRREGLGNDDVTTTIRAEIPGTVVLRGDVPAPAFRKLDGRRSVYAADLDHDGEVQVVNERDTLLVFQAMPNAGELEFTPGTFHHDPESRRLYISTSDDAPPEAHRYTLSVSRPHGLYLSKPRRVVVEGLAATGFNTAGSGDAGYGILLRDARDCVVRDCHAWMNGWGIETSSEAAGSGGNVIERCHAWANDSPFGNDRRGGLSGFRHRGDVIRDSTAFLNANCGIYLRGDADPERASRLVNNLAWGNRWDFIIKSNPGYVNTTECCVGSLYTARKNPIHCLFTRGGRNEGDAPGTIVLNEEKDLDPYREFADPDNRDFRLQATSRFRGTGPDGADRGPFPYEENIFYVKTDGDDDADGLSMAHAWRTLGRAVKDLRPGDTLYLAPGTYGAGVELQARGAEGAPVSIRGRGRAPVVVTGDVRVGDSRSVEFRRLRFEGAVLVSDSTEIAFDNCRFADKGKPLEANGVTGLKVTHCSFAEPRQAVVALSNSARAHLSGNYYYNERAVALRMDNADTVLYADYNGYRSADAAWQVAGKTLALGDVQERHEQHSQVSPPGLAEGPAGFVQNRPAFAAGGPMGAPLGPHRREPHREKLRLTMEPVVHSVSATTADVEWKTSLPCLVNLAWGPTPEMENTDAFEVEYFGTCSLTGLEPGRTYYFRITSLEPSHRTLGQHEPTRLGTIETIPADIDGGISFTTAERDPEPRVYYVAPDGDDGNTGLDRRNAWRTIQRAAGQVSVGDTVLIAGGTYEEQVRVQATGAPGAAITFRSMPGERVVFKGAQLDDAFDVAGKHHLRFDGMYLLSMRFDLYKSTDIEITRSFAGKYGRRYPPVGCLVRGQECRDLLIKNSVALSGKSGPRFRTCADVRIENCVFFRNMIYQLLFYPHQADDRVVLANNIFTDGLPKKFSVPMIGIIAASPEAVQERNNCFFPRRKWQEKAIMQLRWYEPLTFAEMKKLLGSTSSMLANPEFVGAVGVPAETEDGDPIYPVDRLYSLGLIPLNKFFATNPDLVERGIGLQPEAFEDFHFNNPDNK